MDDAELLAQAADAQRFAYPARLTVLRGGGNLTLATVVTDISHAGATLRFESAQHLPEPFSGSHVRLELASATGRPLLLAAQVTIILRHPAGHALAQAAFQNVHLADVEQIEALRGSPHKDQRLLWELWDHLREGEAQP